MITNIIEIELLPADRVVTRPVHQWDIGQIIKVTDAEIEDGTPVDFGNRFMKGGLRAYVIDNQVTIPAPALQQERDLTGYVVITDENSETTVKEIAIPVIPRPKPEDYVDEEIRESTEFQYVILTAAEVEANAKAAAEAAGKAAGSETAAADAKRAAENSATAAAGSANNAAGSATAAAASEEAANKAAGTAGEKATEAGNSAAEALKVEKAIKDIFVTPQMFGAVGDGTTDDTSAMKITVASKEVIDLRGDSYVVTETLELHSIIKNGTIIYTGDVGQPVISLKDGGGLIDVSIVIAVENYASSVVLADYTTYSGQWNPMHFTIDGLNIDNTITTDFVENSSCIKITYDKWKVIGGQNINNVVFNGYMDYGIHIEPQLRNTGTGDIKVDDNPVFNTAVFSNIKFQRCNTALKAYPKMVSGEAETALGGIGLMLFRFTNENDSKITKPFLDLHNAVITGDMVIPWDYYGNNIPESGTYKCHNSIVNVNTAYFMRGNHKESVRYGWFHDTGTGEHYTNHYAIKPEKIGDRLPFREGTTTTWSIDTIKAVRFKPDGNSYEYMGFELTYNNSENPSGSYTVQFGFSSAGRMVWRGYDATNKKWSDLHHIYADGSKPESYSGKRPDGLRVGDYRFDSTYGKPIFWDDEKWVFATGDPAAAGVAFAKAADIPTLLSQLTNDSGFITKAVGDLTNYYLKTETYTQDEINQMLSAIPKFSIQPVDSLPTVDISTTTVYLLKSGEESQNLYTEYIYVNGVWEYLGTQTVDLSGYALKADIVSAETIQSMIDEKFNSIVNGNEVAY